MAKTNIAWTDRVWNPTTGCTRISAGCAHCYAEKMAVRLRAMGQPHYRDGFAPRFHPDALDLPLRWKKPCRIFVNSMSDLFHDDITNEQIAAVFGVMAACPQHTFQILTKRPSRMMRWFRWLCEEAKTVPDLVGAACAMLLDKEHEVSDNKFWLKAPYQPWPLPNVWLGVSAENHREAENRIEFLTTSVPAAMRFVSLEPLLGPIDLENLEPYYIRDRGTKSQYDPIIRYDALRAHMKGPDEYVGRKLDWVIAGCESGPGARPMNEDWVRSLRDQCVAANVPFFYKQRLDRGRKVSMPELDGRVWDQMPCAR